MSSHIAGILKTDVIKVDSRLVATRGRRAYCRERVGKRPVHFLYLHEYGALKPVEVILRREKGEQECGSSSSVPLYKYETKFKS